MILIGESLGHRPSRKYWSSTKCKALFSLDSIFAFASTSIGTKNERIPIKGAPQPFGGQLPQTAPLLTVLSQLASYSVLVQHWV